MFERCVENCGDGQDRWINTSSSFRLKEKMLFPTTKSADACSTNSQQVAWKYFYLLCIISLNINPLKAFSKNTNN